MDTNTQRAPARTTKEHRDKVLKEMLEYHKGTFELLGVANPQSRFYPKSVFTPKGATGRYISLFERELCDPDGFYTELTDNMYNVENPLKRTLYRFRGNEHSKEEYLKDSNGNYGERWYVPVDDLEEINVTSLVLNRNSEEEEVEAETGVQDAPYAKMTIRDYAAIQWKKPVSQKAWLNDLIKKV